jgi:hypothetical protein
MTFNNIQPKTLISKHLAHKLVKAQNHNKDLGMNKCHTLLWWTYKIYSENKYYEKSCLLKPMLGGY